MRKLSQHYQNQHYGSNIAQKCQETPKRFKRLECFKNKNDFLQWLKGLPFQIRYLAVKVEAPEMAETVRQTLRSLQLKYENSEAKKIANSKSNKTILDSLVLTSDGREFFDSICFDFNLIQAPEKLYDLLMYSGQTNKKFNPIQDMKANRRPLSDSIQEIKAAKSKQQLGNILVRVIRHEVFFNTCNSEQIQISQEKNRKKELSFYWKNLSEEGKLQLLRLNNESTKGLSQFLMTQNIQVKEEELEKQIGSLLKLEKNEFCNRIFKCKLKKSLTSLTDYHAIVYKMWKHDFEIKNNSKRRRINRRYPNHAMKAGQNYFQPRFEEVEMKQGKRNYKHESFHEKEHSIYSFQTNETEIYQKLEEVNRRSSKTNFLNDFIDKKIFNNIVECSDAISKEANYYHTARAVAFERIRFILQFYNIPIKLFGSCANGIAIKNSDIDIAIDSTIMNYFLTFPQSQRPKKSLEQLYQIFSSFGCMKDINFYKNARIPILKMTINTEEPLLLDQNFFNGDLTQYINYLNRPHRGTDVQIDITIETHSNDSSKCSHLGINTTKRINHIFKEVKTLKFLVIIMKYFLNNANLNATYKDGINTYAMIIMFLAAIKHLKLEKEENATIVFQQILKFYYREFDEKTYGIDLRNKECIFYRKTVKDTQENGPEFVKADLEILDPENNGFDMTRKCYKYYLIKDLFGKILHKCFQEPRKTITSYFLKDEEIYSASVKNSQEMKERCLQVIASKLGNPFIEMLSKQSQSLESPSIMSFYNELMPTKDEPLVEMTEGLQLVRTQSMIA